MPLEAITLAQLRDRNRAAFCRMPAKLARASFLTDGKNVSATLPESTHVWTGRKWVIARDSGSETK